MFYKNVSTAENDNCTGCTDSLLIWTFKPNEKDTIFSEAGVKKFTVGEREMWFKHARDMRFKR